VLLESGAAASVSAPTNVGTGEAHDEKIELSKLIDLLNQRFGTDFKPSDQLFFDSICEDALADDDWCQTALANAMENSGFVFRERLETLFIERMDQSEAITARFMNDEAFRIDLSWYLLEDVYQRIRSGQH